MPREVDPRRTRKALRIVRQLAAQAETPGAEALSDWEATFLKEVEGRLETYGSAFANLSKGAPEEALSRLQQETVRQLKAKARGKPRKGFKRPGAPGAPRGNDHEMGRDDEPV